MQDDKLQDLLDRAKVDLAQCSIRAAHMRQQAAALIAQAEQAEREGYAYEGQVNAYENVLRQQKADKAE